MKRVTLSLAALSLGLSSCGGDSVTQNDAVHLNGLTQDQKTQIDGNYESGCTVVVLGGGRFYMRIAIEFLNPLTREKDRFVQNNGETIDTRPYGIYVRNAFYDDAHCENEAVRGENKGEFVISNNGEKLSIDSGEMNLAPMRGETARVFNQERMCDFTEWKVGLERSTLKTSCASESSENVFYLSRTDDSPGLKTFDAYICDGNILRSDCSRITFEKQH